LNALHTWLVQQEVPMPRFSPGVVLACVLLAALSAPARGAPIVFSAAGADVAAIQPTVDAFRNALGPLNPNVVGSFGTGRREINWDGGNVNNTNNTLSGTPFDFFNVNSPRGTVFTTPGTGFAQAPATVATGMATIFNNPSYTSDVFPFFSSQRLFSAIGSNVTDVHFFVPGTTEPAFTRGFGVVFNDVDLPDSTSLEFFDVFGRSVGTFFAPTADNGLSFLGVQFTTEPIGRVRITSGNTAPGPDDGGGVDVVMMDDFIFGEPVSVASIPEPSTLALVGVGVVALGVAGRRRGTDRTRLA
jgi:hypothetical protein